MHLPSSVFIVKLLIVFHFHTGSGNEPNNDGVRILNCFIDHLKSLPNSPYSYENWMLDHLQQLDPDTTSIVASILAREVNSPASLKLFKCTATLKDQDGSIEILDGFQCIEDNAGPQYTVNTEQEDQDPIQEDNIQEEQFSLQGSPIQLDNDIQKDMLVTSGEQFIAIPRPAAGVPCAGCSSKVLTSAEGVAALAALGALHLDRHEPGVGHSLGEVLDVERQVQVVNGVRYMLTLKINFDNCSTDYNDPETCKSNKICKITILEKPWVKLPDGNKFRAILANNCTEEWLFGDDGEVISPTQDKVNDKVTGDLDDDIKVIIASESHAQPRTERILSEAEIKDLETQIIPKADISIPTTGISTTESNVLTENHENDVGKVQINENNAELSSFITDSKSNIDSISKDDKSDNGSSISEDKKKDIDAFIGFLENDKPKDNNRKKRSHANHFVGGETMQDPNNENYRKLAIESMKQYLQLAGITQEHKVVKIEKVTTQVVSGSLTKLDFKISPEGGTDGDVISCHSTVWEKSWLKFQEIKVKCKLNDRKKRAARGEPKNVDASDPIYVTLAEESMKKYLHSRGNTKEHKVVTMEKVTTQVVSGSLTKLDFKISPEGGIDSDIISCHSEVWEKPWINFKEIDVKCGLNDRKKRAIPPGGVTEADANDPKYVALAEESMKKYLQSSGNTKAHKVVTIEKVATQVVSGTKTKMDFKISPQGGSDGDIISCHSEVWEKPWLNFKQIDVKCGLNDRKKRAIPPGGVTEADANDPKYVALAEESMKKYLQSSGNTKAHKVVTIEKVTTQVVSGSLTRLDFKISPQGGSDGDIISCHSEVWEKPWLHFKEIDVKCGLNDRKKREIPGGDTEADANDPKYVALAEESMKKYLQSSGNTKAHKVVTIEKVTTQVVSGSLTRLDFKISPQGGSDGDIISCHSEVWEKPWLHFKEIDVKCGLNDRKKRAIPGGVTEADANDPKYLYMKDSKKINSAMSKKNGLVEMPEVVDNDNQYKALYEAAEQEQDAQADTYKVIVQQNLARYLKLNNFKNAHRILQIEKITMRSVKDDELLYKMKYIASETTCPLGNELHTGDSDCELSNPDITLHCEGNLIILVEFEKIEHFNTTCKVVDTTFEPLPGHVKRLKRETDNEEIEESLLYHYGNRAIKEINQRSSDSNLLKIITIHTAKRSIQMDSTIVRMYLECAFTFCLRGQADDTSLCDELEPLNHRLCFAKLKISPADEKAVTNVNVVCDNDPQFAHSTGIDTINFMKLSLKELEKSKKFSYKLIHMGIPTVVPSLAAKRPTKIDFYVASTLCKKDKPATRWCYVNDKVPLMHCSSLVHMVPNSKRVSKVQVSCEPDFRSKRDTSGVSSDHTADEEIRNLVEESIHKLEMSSPHRYKQRLLKINKHSTRISFERKIMISFDVGFTTCLKLEWVDNMEKCELQKHLPVRHCISNINQPLWRAVGRHIDVRCKYGSPLEGQLDDQQTELTNALADIALRHIEAKYPLPQKQKVVTVLALDKQTVAGVHYTMELEVGTTDCLALSGDQRCAFDDDYGANRICHFQIWFQPSADSPPDVRVSCEYQEGATGQRHHDAQAKVLFRHFVKKYQPSYAGDAHELAHRAKVFASNLRTIHELNTAELGSAAYGVTAFADLSREEFRRQRLGLAPALRAANAVPRRLAATPDVPLPPAFDWRERGAVTAVKDQGSCGSCWAFSVTGNVEGAWQLKTGKLVSLSEQELVDCDRLDSGCGGGLPDNAYRAIEQLGGLETEADYPYEGADDKCAFNRTMTAVRVAGAVNVSSDETDMAKWLVKHGPISIGINANGMQFYMGGVSHPFKMLCDPKNLDHGVLIVGYGTKNYPLFHKKLPYWIVKNSWGPAWGESGYYRVYRGDGTCGLNLMASSALV